MPEYWVLIVSAGIAFTSILSYNIFSVYPSHYRYQLFQYKCLHYVTGWLAGDNNSHSL